VGGGGVFGEETWKVKKKEKNPFKRGGRVCYQESHERAETLCTKMGFFGYKEKLLRKPHVTVDLNG